jgi:hypothetical protein
MTTTTPQESACEYDDIQAPGTEKRKRTRIPNLDYLEISFSVPPHDRQTGQLEDISLGGFAMSVEEPLELSAGREILAHFEEGPVGARVAYVEAMPTGAYRVGLEWLEPRSHAVTTILSHCVDKILAYVNAEPQLESTPS